MSHAGTRLMTCQICRVGGEGDIHVVKEMMFGLGHQFDYWECGHCGCLQLVDVPLEWGAYYPDKYYSFRAHDWLDQSGLKAWLKCLRTEIDLRFGPAMTGLLYRGGAAPSWHSWVRDYHIDKAARILDVGAGSGTLVRQLRNAGFRNALGLDAFIPEDITVSGDVLVRRGTALEISGQFDVVIMHHSLEHMENQRSVMEAVRRSLDPAGVVIVGVPVVGQFAWRRYGVHWVQLDAPRHLVLHTVRSLETLAVASGLVVQSVVFDSSGFQFWGSEQYRRGIPLHSEASYLVAPAASAFTETEIAGFERAAAKLNAVGDGDRACFFLRRT